MKSVTAYLNFGGNCREAMTFYQRCLSAELTVSNYPDASGKPSTDPTAKVMHSVLVLRGNPILMASDTPQTDSLKKGNNFSVAIDGDSREETERVFSALVDGGQVRMPMTDAPWGAYFGMLTDRFGVQWMLNCFVSKPSAADEVAP